MTIGVSVALAVTVDNIMNMQAQHGPLNDAQMSHMCLKSDLRILLDRCVFGPLFWPLHLKCFNMSASEMLPAVRVPTYSEGLGVLRRLGFDVSAEEI